MDDKQSQMWDKLCELDGETVARLLTDWHGLQLLDDGFYGHMVDEGYIEEEEKPECCEDCDACPLNIWLHCPDKGDYPEENEEPAGKEEHGYGE